ncbi:MAG TPA: multiheme c-type cytochrome, partial [Longimicrobiales bacterium]|nr:multiheme c-type cytochrome [Longimicrobiales bacterium]
RRFGKRSLPIALRVRSPVLTQFPCTGCHVGATVATAERIDDAHAEIQPLHPAETGAACATCHDPANVELLALGSGERATLDHAYRLCAQCHSTEVDAWANGAHGKRLDGWRGRRVIMSCADCHDPHRPATESRTPFRAPRLHRTGSNEP